MDPFTALAVAGNILQFIQFAGGLLSNTRKIYSSVDGVSDESAHLNDICERLANFHSLLHQSQGGFPECTNRPQSQHEVAISECAALCKKDCEELLTIATKLRAKTSTAKAPRCWGSFKAAMVEVWNAGEIEALKARIADRQRAMTLHICAISRLVSIVQYLIVSYTVPQRKLVSCGFMLMLGWTQNKKREH